MFDAYWTCPGLQTIPACPNPTAVVAEKDAMLRRLRNESLGIIPEGIAGCTHGATPEEEKIYIKERFGFVKIAIQAGAGRLQMLPPKTPVCPHAPINAWLLRHIFCRVWVYRFL